MNRQVTWTPRPEDSLLSLVKDLNANQGVTIIIVTHDAEIARQTRRIIRIVDGMIVPEGRPEPGLLEAEN